MGPKLANETWFGDFEHPVTVVVGKKHPVHRKVPLGAGDGVKNPGDRTQVLADTWTLPWMHSKNICRVSAVCQKRTVLKGKQ